MMEEMIAI